MKPSSFRSGLIDRCERLLVTPLRNFKPGDLRVMLGQQFYPETLVPLALPLLEENPLLDAELYPGDLLSGTLHQATAFWKTSPDLLARIQAVADRVLAAADLFETVRRDIEDFKARTASLSVDVLK
nr:contact-dependent growth inhibition system immunity protein [Deinococcus aestuarii]